MSSLSLLLSSGTPIKAFRYHFDRKMSKQINTHNIQLLTYSSNVQRAVKVRLSLKSKRESEKEKSTRQLTFNARHNTT